MDLTLGLRLAAEVVEVTPNFDQIPNSSKKCHLTIFKTDDGQEYRGQVCNDQSSVPFAAGDIIDIAIRKHTRGIYTFDLERVHKAEFVLADVLAKDIKSISQLSPPHLNVNGTPGALALSAAVQHNQNRPGIKADMVITDAEIFAEFLRINTY